MGVHTPAATSDELSSGGRRSTYRPPLAENGSISAIISSVTGPSDTKSTGCCFFAGTLPVFTCRRYASMHTSVHVHLHMHMLYASMLGCRRERMHRAASGFCGGDRLVLPHRPCAGKPPTRTRTHAKGCRRAYSSAQGAMYMYAQGAAPEAALCGCDGGPLVSRSACATASLLRT